MFRCRPIFVSTSPIDHPKVRKGIASATATASQAASSASKAIKEKSETNETLGKMYDSVEKGKEAMSPYASRAGQAVSTAVSGVGNMYREQFLDGYFVKNRWYLPKFLIFWPGGGVLM